MLVFLGPADRQVVRARVSGCPHMAMLINLVQSWQFHVNLHLRQDIFDMQDTVTFLTEFRMFALFDVETNESSRSGNDP